MSPAPARRRWLDAPPPSLGVELAADRVTVVSLEDGGAVGAYATEPLPPGAIVPSLNGPNVEQPNTAGDALRRALERADLKPGRAALVVPDAVARVSILPFETVPASEADLGQLIRWQVRKSVPFDVDAAQVSWSRGAARDGGAEFIVAVARRDVVEEYESVCARLGLSPGLVDLASFSLVNAVLAATPARGAESDWMLVHVTAADATLAIVRGGDLIFYRNRVMTPDEPLEDLVHQTAMYHEDRLGGGPFGRVVVAGLASGADVRRAIAGRVGVPVETLDARGVATLRDRIGAAPGLLEALAAPVGVLRREVAA